ncbi:MAG TPA: DMT family transporter [Acidimicrobiales bacterium]
MTWLGAILLVGDMALFYSAVKLTSIIDVTVIGASQPALVMLAAPRFFGERLGRRDVVWILLAAVGVTVAVIGPGTTGHHKLAGDLMAVGSLVSFSGYWLVSQRAREEHGAVE